MDFEKTCDFVSWEFLLRVIEAMVFQKDGRMNISMFIFSIYTSSSEW